MSIEENKTIVRLFMQRFSEARLEEAFALLSDDVSWTLWGNGPGAGTYTKAGMKDLLIQSWQWFDGVVKWTPTEFTAEDDRVAVEATSSALTRGGYCHRGQYHNLFRLKNGKIIEVKEMFLESPVQALFKALQAESAAPIRT
jgi:ketosteroid isomerase-like protein